MTCRPDLVAMRTKKPWVLFLFVLLFVVNDNFIIKPLLSFNKGSHKPHRIFFVKTKSGYATDGIHQYDAILPFEENTVPLIHSIWMVAVMEVLIKLAMRDKGQGAGRAVAETYQYGRRC